MVKILCVYAVFNLVYKNFGIVGKKIVFCFRAAAVLIEFGFFGKFKNRVNIAALTAALFGKKI